MPYHPDPVIDAGVRADANAAEVYDLSIGYPPRRWTCDCGASHSRGFFPYGSTSHRCLKCGYCGPGGVMTLPDGRP